MAISIVSTDLTTTQTLDGSDTMFVTQSGSIVQTTSFTEAIQLTGSLNTLYIHGLVAGHREAIEITGGSGHSIVIGETGRVIGLHTNSYAMLIRGDENLIANHGEITGSFAVGMLGSNSLFFNTGTISSTFAGLTYVTGVAIRGTNIKLDNTGTIFGTDTGVGIGFDTVSPTDTVIENSGLISGDKGIWFTNGNGLDIDNTGTITGSGGTAIHSLATNTKILNTGTINGDVLFENTGAFIKNSGQILGDVFLDASGSYYKGAVDGWVSGGVRGDIGNDTIYGASGFDYIEGGGGADYIKGRAGDDRIFGEEGADTIRGNDGDDEINGNQGTDLLFGGRGDDTIDGGSASDTIKGGNGDDLLSGGTGTDVFIFGRNSGVDEITDFKNNTDKLDLSAFAVSSRQDLTNAGAIIENGAGSIIDLTAIGGDGEIMVEDMSVAQWSASDFIF